jgi:predicted nucleic acid-binding protein
MTMNNLIFVDTSALLAVLCQNDANHQSADKYWATILRESELFCNNYVIVETHALVQKRLGMHFVGLFESDVVPVLQVQWVQLEEHQKAIQMMITAGKRSLSLVDCTSFVTMRRLGIQKVFTFDSHFADQGFTCLPGEAAP